MEAESRGHRVLLRWANTTIGRVPERPAQATWVSEAGHRGPAGPIVRRAFWKTLVTQDLYLSLHCQNLTADVSIHPETNKNILEISDLLGCFIWLDTYGPFQMMSHFC
ncbi:hypothetical protein DPEC_G00051380 [Dallia pectoralis]|uniref:Uncharacterized protein n=1 Tax=Dallia pectoralis TaxID=75939 RepID=A0ACC2HBY9_DALPE|nr:hypothetical protein DPEC_G00051380 [Dallia pectoralis]